ncbi:hypothetical protein SAMN02745857_01623 [Andreprevotia lacus DSM 23236]|jgi:hypothetical protein|uniref:DUF1223 domain-containing protein n=1 Tax=Andreprevotia lacus DSM 23236 TaxID=1121001 RepID=A0A1W1XHN2_9NEIS|nr:DUF1223 domain-containing protein [Andreprevotia lacus]SMC23516.1 hypothetical protein SAMN02745857_01623 [Andreprevotia lacus DSM 23236]
MKTINSLWAGALLAATALAGEPACRMSTTHSSEPAPVLAELYTSEGCSSCPPAERWLSGLAAAGLPRARVIPLAFHVDYWDYLGWRDRFADAAYTRRQQSRARTSGASFVYTPQLLLNGRDTRSWIGGYDVLRNREKAQAKPAAALSMLLQADPQGLVAAMRIEDALPNQQLYLALYEDGLSSQVQAGENKGERLLHDAVVRRLAGPFPVGTDGKLQTHVVLQPPPGQDLQRSGVAAWLEDAQGGVVQAIAAQCVR